MGMLSASTMVSRVRSALGNYDVGLISDDFILQWLNQAIYKISVKYPFTEFCKNENITTSNGTAEYPMVSTDVMYVENVVNTTRYNDLKRCDDTDYDLWTSSSLSPGPPTHYFITSINADNVVTGDSRKITFFPTPNTSYVMRVRYRSRPTALVIDPAANFAPLSSMWDFVLIYYAIADGFLHLSEAEKAQAFLQLAMGEEMQAWKNTVATSEVPVNTSRVFRSGIGGF